jgi:hypothetical protein
MGVIIRKNIRPNIKGLIIFPINNPNFNHILFRGVNVLEKKRVVIIIIEVKIPVM